MLIESVITYFHYLGFMVLFAALVTQHLLFAPLVTPGLAKRLAVLDAIYGLSALVVLLTGLAKTFWVGKPAVFYAANGFFHAKVTLFLVVALLSVWPTLQFLKARKAAQNLADNEQVVLPVKIRMIQRIQLLALMIIPLLAACMVRLGSV